ncbi:hypothetical protein [Terrabacter sp. NPDC000476]|uniref:type II secretion system F family protein n=1 Tax=Terrabacter sp. NPDC000476 TaxID=3154258 RepID=UPI0033245126
MGLGVDVVRAVEIVAAALLGGCVLLWPSRPRPWQAGSLGSPGPVARQASEETLGGWRRIWHEDPVELFRRWRLRRRSDAVTDAVVELLRGIGPALEAGLPPARALALAAEALLGPGALAGPGAVVGVVAGPGAGAGPESVAGLGAVAGPGAVAGLGAVAGRGARPVPEAVPMVEAGRGAPAGGERVATSRPVEASVRLLVSELVEATGRGESVAAVWSAWAGRTSSPSLALVASAWQLTESTGAPLALAVERATRGLLDARSRRGRVAVAVAGPRASVTVLTLLPLAGPLVGLACGIDPRTLYLGSPLTLTCLGLGLALVGAGRAWCTRMIRTAVRA